MEEAVWDISVDVTRRCEMISWGQKTNEGKRKMASPRAGINVFKWQLMRERANETRGIGNPRRMRGSCLI